ncbi:RUN and FYVE domain-containing protein 2-like [Corticium candelabrum]|uniref:RUN and FYVE domain-containing protein 2-like n=1 Tax=Corticium candelabrum TaxID=121492 RepID=UPI002E3322A5|nr:RUN and FYVE domain-containing protein 2-like [Corticium candelabrum]
MVANLQRSAVRDALNQFREPWRCFKGTVHEWYEPFAMMAVEEGSVIAGMLVGLNVIDCNLCLKGEDLDKQVSVIDFSLYLKDGNYLERPVESEADARAMFDMPEDPNYRMLLDQKAYLEELNSKLKVSLSNMQKKLEATERVNAKLVSELADMQADVTSLQVHRDQLQSERDMTTESHRKQIENALCDITTERETYQQSREGLNELFLQAQKQLEAETRAREEAEKDAALQSNMRQECEVAMKLLEKDIHEKQDTIIALRKQLEDVKSLNLGMHQKLQASQVTSRSNEEKMQNLEETVSRLSNQAEQLSASYTESESNRLSLEETLSNVSQQMTAVELKKSELETELTTRKEWIDKLQVNFQKEHDKGVKLQSQLEAKTKLQQEYDKLHQEYTELQTVCHEQETALVEMGDHLRQSRMQVSDLKQVTDTMKDYQWADDRSITDCQQCKKPFSVARRKHHCRNCGGVFCSSCSDNTMPLPSSAKPVRVCDSCHDVLLQRYNVT